MNTVVCGLLAAVVALFLGGTRHEAYLTSIAAMCLSELYEINRKVGK